MFYVNNHRFFTIYRKLLKLTFALIIISVAMPSEAIGQSLAQFSNKFICDLATDEVGSIRRWTNDSTLQKYIFEANRRGLNCLSQNHSQNSQNQVSLLRKGYTNLLNEERVKIQINLKNLNFYKGKIDGLYGNQTENALKLYNAKYLNDRNLHTSDNVKALFVSILTLAAPKTQPRKPKEKNGDIENNEKIFNVSSGTGFFVSSQGHIITNHHVVEGCENVVLVMNGKSYTTVQIDNDKINDLALLKTSISPIHIFALRTDKLFELLDIVVAGFPFGDDISSSLKFTKGVVSALTGIGNNYSEIQIDAALQPGNSGGPIMDDFGNIVGVAVAKLDAKAVMENYGVTPENTNFGIKATVVRSLLEANRISLKTPNSQTISKKELSKLANEGTVFLNCWMTFAQIQEMRKKKAMFEHID